MSYSIPRIDANATASTATFNAPLTQIQKALNNLDTRIAGLASKSAVIQQGVTLDSDVIIGDVVYFDSKDGACFKKALAKLRGQPGAQGQSVQAPSSRVQGIVIDKAQTGSTGTLLRCGYYQGFSLDGSIQESSDTAGLYYLSPRVAGKITKNPGWNMRQPCISFYGADRFSMITNYLAHDNHHHTYVQLTSSNGIWAVPIDRTGQISSQTSVIVYNGKVALPSEFSISSSSIEWKGSGSAPSKISVFNVIPFAYGDSVVRAIKSQTLSVDSLKGTYQIDMPAYTSDSVLASSAIHSIEGTTIKRTPVVSKIEGGPGITAETTVDGTCTVSLKSMYDYPMIAEQMYMNGTQRVATSLLTYTLFPKGITSSATISLPVQDTDGKSLSVSIWLRSKGDSAGTLTVYFYFIPMDQQNATSIPAAAEATISIGVSSGTSNTLRYTQGSTGRSINRSGTLIAKIQAAPSADFYVYQMGFKLTAD